MRTVSSRSRPSLGHLEDFLQAALSTAYYYWIRSSRRLLLRGSNIFAAFQSMPSNRQAQGLASGRTPREIKTTKKVQQSLAMGEKSPGFNSSSPLRTPASPPSASPPVPRTSTCTEIRPVATATTLVSTEASELFDKPRASSQPPPASASVKSSSTPPPASNKMAPKARATAAASKTQTKTPKAKPTSSRAKAPAPPKYNLDIEPSGESYAPDGTLIPQLDSRNFIIYQWPYPAPRNFAKLTKLHQTFKEEADKTQNQLNGVELGDGAEDWGDFVGDLDLYESESARARAIASNIVYRAKHAYREDSSWSEFERDERAANTPAAAKRGPNPAKRRMISHTSLRNDVRLAVFDAIRLRLRAEIWLEYEEMGKGTDPASRERQDSAATTPAPAPIEVLAVDGMVDQTAIETEEHLTKGWKIGSGGWRPIPVWKDAPQGNAEHSDDEVDLSGHRRWLTFGEGGEQGDSSVG